MPKFDEIISKVKEKATNVWIVLGIAFIVLAIASVVYKFIDNLTSDNTASSNYIDSRDYPNIPKSEFPRAVKTLDDYNNGRLK